MQWLALFLVLDYPKWVQKGTIIHMYAMRFSNSWSTWRKETTQQTQSAVECS
jgi:hypothetical protein